MLYNAEIFETTKETPENFSKNEKEAVNHPKHYNRDGAMECIDEMIEVFGIEPVKNFCLCNVWKYRYRQNDKNGTEDIRKSDFYMKKYMELKEKQNVAMGKAFTNIHSPIISER